MIFRNVAIVLLSLISIHSLGANISSNGTGGGIWSSGTSWLGGVVPGIGDNVAINNGDIITVTSSVTVDNLNINGNSGLTINNSITLTSSGQLYIYGTAANQTLAIINNGILIAIGCL